jgi:hypothetical protein
MLGFTQPILTIDPFCKRSLYFPTEIIKSTNLLHLFSLRGFSRDYLSKNLCTINVIVVIFYY